MPPPSLAASTVTSLPVPPVTPEQEPPRPSRPRAGRLASRVLPPVVGVVLVVVAWQLLAAHNRYLLPRPAATFDQLLRHPGLFASNGRTTLAEALIGLGIGFGAAVVLAVAMSQLRVIERAVMPLAVVLNVTPVVAVAPAMVVAFGFGRTPKVVVTALIVFFPALINALAGLRSADPQVLDVLRTLHASRGETLRRVLLPSAVPHLFVAARVCLPLSVIGAVVAEFVAPGSSAGLGNLVNRASADSQLSVVYAGILALAVLGVALAAVLAVVERRLLAWDPRRSAP